MDVVSPEHVEMAQECVRVWNETKSEMCGKCTEGKYYRPEDFIPYLVFDPSTIRHEEKFCLTVTGKCTTCGQSADRWISIGPR